MGKKSKRKSRGRQSSLGGTPTLWPALTQKMKETFDAIDATDYLDREKKILKALIHFLGQNGAENVHQVTAPMITFQSEDTTNFLHPILKAPLTTAQVEQARKFKRFVAQVDGKSEHARGGEVAINAQDVDNFYLAFDRLGDFATNNKFSAPGVTSIAEKYDRVQQVQLEVGSQPVFASDSEGLHPALTLPDGRRLSTIGLGAMTSRDPELAEVLMMKWRTFKSNLHHLQQVPSTPTRPYIVLTSHEWKEDAGTMREFASKYPQEFCALVENRKCDSTVDVVAPDMSFAKAAEYVKELVLFVSEEEAAKKPAGETQSAHCTPTVEESTSQATTAKQETLDERRALGWVGAVKEAPRKLLRLTLDLLSGVIQSVLAYAPPYLAPTCNDEIDASDTAARTASTADIASEKGTDETTATSPETVVKDEAASEATAESNRKESCLLCFGTCSRMATLHCGCLFCRQCIIDHGKENNECPECSSKLCLDIHFPPEITIKYFKKKDVCFWCNKKGPKGSMKLCKGCQAAGDVTIYCNSECAKAAWLTHKKTAHTHWKD